MSLPGNGIFVVRGEMSIMITAMRHYTRKWNSTYVDEDKDSLIKRFMRVKTLLNRIEDLRKIKPQIYLKPFLEVIRSEETTGADTSLALAAINKFLSCGLLDSSIPNLALIVQSIVDAVRHARFRGADQSSDIITIFGVVEVLHTLMLRPEGEALTNEAVCEVMYSCFKICFEPRTNSTQLLQRFAEKALKDIVLLLFTRLPLFPEEDYSETTGCVKKIQMSTTDKTNNRKAIPNANHRNERIERDERKMVSIASTSAAAEPLNFSAPENMSQINTSASACDVNTNVVELQTSLRTGARGTSTTTSTTTIGETPSPTLEASNSQTAIINVGAGILTETTNQSEIPTDNSQDLRTSNERESRCNNESDYINSLGVRFTQQQQYPQQEQQFTTTTGNSGDDSTSNLLPYGLPCIQELFRFLVLLCNPLDIQNTDIMKHMGLSLLTAAFEVAADSLGKYETILELIKGDLCRYLLALLTSERLSIFAADLQLSFLLFRSLRGHLKYQLEAYLKKLSEIILNDNLKMQIRELALDNLLQLWCTPNFVTELYINYDCDAYCSNVFEDITNLLCKYILTKENVDNTHLIATDAILTVVYNIEHNCSLKMKNGNSDDDGGDGEEEDSNKADAYVDNYLVKNGTMAQSSSSCLIRHSRDNSDLEGIIIDSMNHVTNETSPGINSTQSLDTDNQVSEVEGAPSSSTLAQEYLVNLKRRKQLIAHGTELFNQRTEKGAKYCGKAIEYLQKHGILKVPLDPREIATFLRENPSLDKRNIGEYICKKDIIEAKILKYYVESFDFTNMSVDQALRSFLEEFRLSGEAPVILLVLECFVDHWREQNGEPFANADAAFTLAYSIILLNTDQHNANAKSSNVPMTEEHFRKNLRGANGGDDFDQDMLASIYNSIKNEEIVIPAEQTGIIRDNYIWRVLLRRGSSPDANYKFVNHSMYDLIIFKIIWGPTLSSLSFMFDKTNEHGYKRILKGFTKCAGIIFHYNLYEDFDALILTLCKFTTLLPMIQQELPSSPISTIHHLISNEQAVNFGRKPKAQAAMRTVFNLVHDYGDCLREGWRHIFDLYLQLFRLKLLPKSLMEVEDFCEATGKAQLILEKPSQQKQESGLFSSLYSYLSSDGQREPSLEEKELIKVAKKCIKDCQLDQMIQESKFVHYDSLQELLKHVLNLLKAPTAHKSIGLPYAEDAVVFWMEFLVKIVIYNRDRMIPLWLAVRNHMYFLLMGAAFCGYDYLLNRCIVAILKLAIYLMRNEELCPIVLKSLKMLVMLKPQAILKISKQISIGIYELLKTSAQNIHTKEDWQIVFLILECVGAGREPPEIEDITLSMPLNGAWAKSDGALSSDGSDSGLPDKDRDKDYVSESEVFGGLNINITPYSSTKQTMPKSMIPKSVVTTTTNCSNTNSPPHPSSPISENWILVNKESDLNILSRPQSPSIKGGISPPLTTLIYNCTLMPHSPFALFKCWDSLAFIVRNVAHITPYNFESCVRCIRTFVEASINGGWKAKSSAIGVDGIGCSNQKRTKHKRLSQYSHEPSKHVISPSGSDEENACEPDNTDLAQRYETLSIQLLDLMYTLYTRTAQIFRWWAEEGCAVPQGSDLWIQGWCPVLQGIARLAMDRRREVRTYAISCLQQRALLVHDLQALSSKEWASCFYQVLFPLLNDLLPESASVRHLDAQLLEESRIRIATIMAKVFLHHLAPLLELDDFNELWLQILTYIEKFMSVRSDMLKEQMQEVLKNMLLVMHSVRVFHNPNSNLWSITWHRIGQFLPELKRELFHNEGNLDHNTTNNNNNSNDSSNNNILTSSQRTHQTLITPSMDILDQKSHNNNNNNNNNNNSNNSISDKNYYNVTSTASKAAISLRTELFSPLLSPIDSPRQSGSSSIILQPPTPDIISCPTLLSQIPVIVPQCVSQSLDIGITAEYSSLNFKTKDMDQQLERQQQQQQQQQQQRQELEQEQEQENHYNYQLQQQSIVSDTSSFSNMKTAIVTAAETIVDATAYNVNHPTGNLINEGNSTSFTIELPEITANDHHNVDTKNLIGLKQYQYAEQSDYNPIKVDNPLIMSQQLYSATTEAQASTTAIIANSSNNDCDDVTANAIFNANLCNNDIDHKESYTDTSVNVSLTPIIAATNAYPSLSHPPTTAIMHSFAPVRISNQQAQQMQQWQKQQQQQQQTVQSTEIKQSSITTDIYQEYLQNPYNLTLNQSCLMPHICETTTTATVTMTTVATVTTITTPTTTTKTMTTSTTLGTIPGAIIKVTLQQQQQQEQQQEEQNCQRQPGEIVAASVVFTPANYFSKSLDGGNGVSDDDEWLRGGDGRP